MGLSPLARGDTTGCGWCGETNRGEHIRPAASASFSHIKELISRGWSKKKIVLGCGSQHCFGLRWSGGLLSLGSLEKNRCIM